MKIPIEIFVYEILSRTSLETVACCRMVSKKINEATYETKFTQLFYKRANIASGVRILKSQQPPNEVFSSASRVMTCQNTLFVNQQRNNGELFQNPRLVFALKKS
ncbi:hypothetical protein G4B88_015740 [Cannabis sativa]|uniref:F-box domain-containing protein n=1 Tax=Cannabis sativa TaxID=3483 RepID=A0A7J6H8E2_CANSA|nr:hypothetical protein G4B88_015740 [Cannabis sativa]